MDGFITLLHIYSSALYVFFADICEYVWMYILVIVLNDPELVECMHTYHYFRMQSSSFNANVVSATDSERRFEVRKKCLHTFHIFKLIASLHGEIE